MAASEVLPVGNDEDSAEVTIEAGEVVAFGLKGAGAGGALPAGGQVLIGLIDDAGNSWTVGRLRSSDPVTVLSIPGTYEFKRIPGTSVGVFRAA